MENSASFKELNDICVAGITPFTTIDFPGRLAGVFYLQGCPWRCRYCYNAEFWPMPPAGHLIATEKILQFLDSRRGQLDGIVFSGGDPTVHKRLPVWMRAVKDMGFEIGLHTGGMFPERLAEVLPLCDWVGFDIKAPFGRYEGVTGIPESGEVARRSLDQLLSSGVAYECRTTFHPELLSEKDVMEIAMELSCLGVKKYVLQFFRPDHCPDKELRENSLQGVGISAGLRQNLHDLFPDFLIRE
jgi:pyruvate formate lyase activating enzyme